ncbi:MAG: hypothetical protein H6605_10735 [Flavobacteriales bacterium]|nr:hypothetical protein [Flavobacteriales bacterium]
MRTKEIKSQIHKVIDEIPEGVLENILEYLKQLQETPYEKVNLTRNLKRIISEDKELLEKLAN